MNGLTHSCFENSLTIVVCTCDTFENHFEIKQKFEKYLKGSCWFIFDLHFSFKYYLQINSVFEISPKYSGGIGHYRHEWFEYPYNPSMAMFVVVVVVLKKTLASC